VAAITFPLYGLPVDSDLVRRAGQGDRSAFGLLYERYARVVHGIILARVAPEDAEDLVQDVFIVVMRRLPNLRAPEAFPGWIATIARNRAADHYRTRRGQSEPLSDRLPGTQSAGARLEAHRILDCIRSLPEAYRETLVLRLVEEFTGPEIAERTGLTTESVRVNLCRGMKLLREKLGAGSK